MAYNKYAGPCHFCGNRVAAKAGQLLGKKAGRWAVAHLSCADTGKPEVVEVYFPSTGSRVYQNARGRCEDAPCCGCCT